MSIKKKNEAQDPQYEGIIFTDGTCVIRWLTAVGSTSVWDSFEEAMLIHGHPEYGTHILFYDGVAFVPWDTHSQDKECYHYRMELAHSNDDCDVFMCADCGKQVDI